MKNNGFGIVQLLITIVILGMIGMAAYKSYFLSGQKSIEESGKIYDSVEQPAAQKTGNKAESVHTRKAKELEGRVFINSVVTAERTYEAVNGHFVYTGWTSESKELGINARGNEYFKEFSIDKKQDGGFLVKVKGSGELEGVILTSE
ncbi:MAG: hypothetical protein LBL00_00725 [Endomicrobium sp.]|jgi:hypothetical protein|nr:hypothetical protein [Endomicrobium sp.]